MNMSISKINDTDIKGMYFNETKEKILKIKAKYQNSLQYPFDIVYEYVFSIYNLFEKVEVKETQKEKIEKVIFYLI
jgi:hypothetical protein